MIFQDLGNMIFRAVLGHVIEVVEGEDRFVRVVKVQVGDSVVNCR